MKREKRIALYKKIWCKIRYWQSLRDISDIAETEWEALKLTDDYKKGYVLGTKSKNMTVYQAFTQYIESRNNILSPSTIRGYRIIRDTRLQLIREMHITELKLSDIQRAVNHDSGRLSRKSIKSSVGLLKSVLSMQDIDMNLRKITLPQAKNTKKPIPNAEEVLKIVVGTEQELPCLLAMWLSLRVSEVRGLQFRDISDDGRYITIRRARMCLDGKDVLREQNKTAESTRTNMLPPYILKLIRKVSHENDTDFIVSLSYYYIQTHFKKLMESNGFDISFHKLRHEFATTLNDLGIPSDYIQKLGGWSTDNVMKSVYTHTTASKEQEYQSVIDAYFNNAIKKLCDHYEITRKSHECQQNG